MPVEAGKAVATRWPESSARRPGPTWGALVDEQPGWADLIGEGDGTRHNRMASICRTHVLSWGWAGGRWEKGWTPLMIHARYTRCHGGDELMGAP
jgi:hypothetical protein